MTNAEAIFDLEQFALAPIGDGDLHRESVELALSALREQAERNKGCECCNDPGLMYGAISFPLTENGKIDFDKVEAIAACFCPNCGKPLKGGTA